MKVLRNKLTGEEIYANGVNFKDNTVRLSSGEDKPAPALWTDFHTHITAINDQETVRLSNTDDFITDYELIDK